MIKWGYPKNQDSSGAWFRSGDISRISRRQLSRRHGEYPERLLQSTDESMSAEAISEAEYRKLSEMLEHAPALIATFRGPDHVYESANSLYLRRIGKENILGRPLVEVLPESKEQGIIELLDRVYQTGERFTDTEKRFFLLNGRGESEEIYLNFVCQPQFDENSTVTGIMIHAVEVTERVLACRQLEIHTEALRKSEQQLQKINETLEKRVEERTASLLAYQAQLRSLASQLSKAEERERQRLATELHDNLGQVLAVSKMELDLLLNDRIPEYLRESFNGLKRLTEDAIRYTCELMSDLKPPPGVDTEEMGNILNWLAQRMEKHGLAVTTKGNKLSNQIDEELRITLLQSVRELLLNVAKHADTNEATLTVAIDEGMAEIIVEDHGKGFNPRETQLSGAGDDGFGLLTIRERMYYLGGNLKIISEIGKGTRAILNVPLMNEHENDKTDRHNMINSLTSGYEIEVLTEEKIKVMLIDDHAMMRSGLKKMIEQEHDLVVVAEASNGREAIEVSRRVSPDVIVMDVDMPVLNGIEATREIISRAPDTRIIGLSLHEDAEVERSMRSAGATVYLTKNDIFETLCATVRSEAAIVKND